MTSTITAEMIDRAESLGAGQAMITWLRSAQRSMDEMIEYCRTWALWCVQHIDGAVDLISDDGLDTWIFEAPREIVPYVAHRISITPWLVDKLAKRDPGIALQYAAGMLTPERRAWCKAQLERRYD